MERHPRRRSKQHLGLPDGTIKVYVLVEQVEACFQLMEIRAALGPHFVGFNTGRWDYINSVADAMAWDRDVRQSEHRRHHDDLRLHARLRGPRAPRRATRPTQLGQFALWQGGMEPNIPVGSEAGVDERHEAGGRRRRARTARGRQRQVGRPLEDGPHRPAGLGEGRAATTSSAGRSRRSRYTPADADGLIAARAGAAHRPRRARSAQRRAAVRQRVLAGLQAAALKPADFFGNDDVLYLMEDMATGEIRLSILWEWLHKDAPFTADDDADRRQGRRSLHAGAVRAAARRGVREAAHAPATATCTTTSKNTTLPIAREIVETYVAGATSSCRGTSTCSTSISATTTSPKAKRRIGLLAAAFARTATRITENLDF